MSASRKLYREIAISFRIGMRQVASTPEAVAALAEVARLVAADLKQDNIRFDSIRFYEACGLDEQGRPAGDAFYDEEEGRSILP